MKCKGCGCIQIFYEITGCSFECFNDKLEIECSHPTECFCDLRTPSILKDYTDKLKQDSRCSMCKENNEGWDDDVWNFCIECENYYIQKVCCMSGKRSIENYHPEGVKNES